MTRIEQKWRVSCNKGLNLCLFVCVHVWERERVRNEGRKEGRLIIIKAFAPVTLAFARNQSVCRSNGRLCVRERGNERGRREEEEEREGGRGGMREGEEKKRERESVCVCLCLCVCVIVIEPFRSGLASKVSQSQGEECVRACERERRRNCGCKKRGEERTTDKCDHVALDNVSLMNAYILQHKNLIHTNWHVSTLA